MANDPSVQLAAILEQTLSPDVNVRKPAEQLLQSNEDKEGYSILLLNLISREDLAITIRIAGSIAFKNFIKRNWAVSDDNVNVNKISETDRGTVRNAIVNMMLHSPEQIQLQLSDAVSIIGREDFPKKWPGLLDEMLTQIQASDGNFHIINGVLRTAHSLFKRYRHEFKSQELWTEIKYVLDRFAKPFTDLFVATIELAKNQSNVQNLKIIFSSLVLCSKIFYSLNAQDLPEFFEDNISVWMDNFLVLLSIDNKLLHTEESEEVGLLEQLKSQICDNIGMYAQKYNEEFQGFLPQFVQTVWNLLINTGNEPKYDLLVSNAMNFLSIVADRNQYQDLFKAENVLDSISSKVIIPNMEFRQSDEELFEDNPEEYIRRDIEGSDVDTRRRAACELVKALSKYFEAQITQIFLQYINAMLESFATNPQAFWKRKDAAIYLVTSISVKGSTARFGTTNTSDLVDITDFYNKFVKDDLSRTSNLSELPVLRADALKYIVTFRNQLPFKETILPSFPLIIQHLSAPSVVVHTYAANVLEKLFTMKDPTDVKKSTPLVKATDLQPLIPNTIQGLLNIFDYPGSSENEYAMKALMRSLSLLQENILPILGPTFSKLLTKLNDVSKNPSKPHFNHYLFETICLSIKIAFNQKKASLSTFEQALFPVFQNILTNDVQEFMPYVFQLLSMFIELRENQISAPYMQLFPFLLAPALWERPANCAPLARLLVGYVEKDFVNIENTGKIQPLLGVFQKLNASKANDHHGFLLLQSLIEFGKYESLEPYMKQIFVLLFQRLTTSKTTKFIKCCLVFFSFFSYKYGGSSLISIIESLQPQMFGMVIRNLFVTEVQKVSDIVEKKICAVGITKLLCETQEMLSGIYANLWPSLLKALIGLFELPEDDSVPDDEHFAEIEDISGYQASYSQLVFARKKERDPISEVMSPRTFLLESLKNVSTKYPGQITALISTVDHDTQAYIHKYLQSTNFVFT